MSPSPLFPSLPAHSLHSSFFFFTRWTDGDALFPRLLSPSIILRNGPPCSEYLPEGGTACFSIPRVEEPPHSTNYTASRESVFPVGFIAVIAEVTHDRRSSFCSRFQSGRLYAARRPTHAQALPLLPTGRPGLAFFALGVWPGRGRRTTTNSELPSAEYLGSIFVFLGSSWQNENELLGQTELRGTVRFFPANLRSPPVQMQR